MAVDKSLKFLNNGEPLDFGVNGFASNKNGGNAFFVGDSRNVLLTVVGTGSILIHGSAQREEVDFTAPSTITNSHATIVTADYSVANTFYDGATGVTAAANTVIVELNTNLLSWVGIERVGLVETVDVIVTEADNQ